MNDELNLKGSHEGNNITFNLSKEIPPEVIKINSQGFFWKGKLVEEDKEIYNRFNEWLTRARTLDANHKYSTVEEYQSLVELLKQALRFYANKSTYGHYMGNPSSIDLDEWGSQARFALEQAEKIEKANLQIQEDYNKLVVDSEELESNGETNPIDLIKYFNETHEDNNI